MLMADGEERTAAREQGARGVMPYQFEPVVADMDGSDSQSDDGEVESGGWTCRKHGLVDVFRPLCILVHYDRPRSRSTSLDLAVSCFVACWQFRNRSLFTVLHSAMHPLLTEFSSKQYILKTNVLFTDQTILFLKQENILGTQTHQILR